MSARESLGAAIDMACPYEEGERLIDAFRDEVLREAAEKLRKQQHAGHDQIKCVPCFIYGHAADLVDPDKDAP